MADDDGAGFFNLPRVLALAVAVAVFAGMVGYRIGASGDPELSDVDAGFLSDMHTHHSGALTLAFAYLSPDNDTTIGHIGREVVVDQSIEMNFMTTRLAEGSDDEVDAIVEDDVAMEWMGDPVTPAEMPGLATAAEIEELGELRGLDADEMFSRLIIEHHVAGIEMARFAAKRGSDDVTRSAARSMARAQTREVRELNARRQALGFDPVEVDLDAADDGGHGHD
jgi:uncharacterized protein (DUF305 family)